VWCSLERPKNEGPSGRARSGRGIRSIPHRFVPASGLQRYESYVARYERRRGFPAAPDEGGTQAERERWCEGPVDHAAADSKVSLCDSIAYRPRRDDMYLNDSAWEGDKDSDPICDLFEYLGKDNRWRYTTDKTEAGPNSHVLCRVWRSPLTVLPLDMDAKPQ